MFIPLRWTGFLVLIGIAGTSPWSALAATSGELLVNGVVVSKNKCLFTDAGAAIEFGTLDPASGLDVTKETSIRIVCNGSSPQATFVMGHDNGKYGGRLWQEFTPYYLPYSISMTPTSATVNKGEIQTIRIFGTVRGVDYQDAVPGIYTDTVTLSITP